MPCRFLFHQFIHRDEGRKAIANADVLTPFAASLIRGFNADSLDKRPQSIGRSIDLPPLCILRQPIEAGRSKIAPETPLVNRCALRNMGNAGLFFECLRCNLDENTKLMDVSSGPARPIRGIARIL